MKRYLSTDNCVIYRCDAYHDPDFDTRTALIDSVMSQPVTSRHTRLLVYSRGRHAGMLTVLQEDAEAVVRKLME